MATPDGAPCAARIVRADMQVEKVEAGEISLSSAIFLMVFVVSTAFFFAVLQGSGIAGKWVSSAPILAVVASLLVTKCAAPAHFMRSAFVGIALVILSLALSNIYFDFSNDGIGYHAEAIIELASRFDFFKSTLHGSYGIYTNNYPKLAWFYGAAIFRLSGNMELAKSINFLLIFAVALVALSVTRRLRADARVLVCVGVAANPVVLTQLFTHYVDGCMASFIAIQILSLYGYFRVAPSRNLLLAFGLSLIGCAALKHTGLVFSTISAMAFIALAWRGKTALKPYLLPWWPITGLALVGAVLCANPYAKNLIEGHHIFYPSMGKGRVENLISAQTTPEFYSLDRFSQVALSVFGKTSNESPSDPVTPRLPELKLPFSMTDAEMSFAGAADVRWGGWGPLFGGACVVALAFGLLSLRALRPEAPLLLLVLVLCFISPESWWARLNPQVYLLVALAGALALTRHRFAGYAICLILIANSAVVEYSALTIARNGNAYLHQAVNELTSNGREPVYWRRHGISLGPMFDRFRVRVINDSPCDGKSCTNFKCKSIIWNSLVCVKDQPSDDIPASRKATATVATN